MAVSKRLRYEILRRDDHTCRYCGGRAPVVALTVDHVIPVALGGNDEPPNLVAACRDCNAGKSASSPDGPIVDGVTQDALRWAAAMKQAAEMQLIELDAIARYADAFYDMWLEWGIGDGPDRITFEDELPNDWRRTLEIWQGVFVGEPDLKRAIRIASTKKNLATRDIWKYMCGVIWRQLDERQRIAQELLERPVEPPTASEFSAPEGTCWLDGVLVDSESLLPIGFPKALLLFDDAHRFTVAAKAMWPDLTSAEVLWGYPRFHAAFGEGLQHRLNATNIEYNLNEKSRIDASKYLVREIETALVEATA